MERAELSCVVEKHPAGTGGALAQLRGMLEPRFFLLNGDSFVYVDWGALAGALGSDSGKQVGVLCLAKNPGNANRYGAVRQADDGRVIGFEEKNAAPSTKGMIIGGVYALFSRIIDTLISPCSLEQDVLPDLAGRGLLASLVCEGAFIDIGTPEDYERAQAVFAALHGTVSDEKPGKIFHAANSGHGGSNSKLPNRDGL